MFGELWQNPELPMASHGSSVDPARSQEAALARVFPMPEVLYSGREVWNETTTKKYVDNGGVRNAHQVVVSNICWFSTPKIREMIQFE